MTLHEITNAVDAGNRVHWCNAGYIVTRDCLGQYLITFTLNGSAVGLTNRDGTHLNGQPEDFYLAHHEKTSTRKKLPVVLKI